MYYFIDNKYDEEVIEFFVDNLIKNKWDISQILGEERSSKIIAEIYSQKTGQLCELKENLIVYKLDKLLDVKIPDGRFRKCDKNDMSYLPQWACQFWVDAKLDGKTTPAKEEKRILSKLDVHYIWETNVPVSMTHAEFVSDDCVKVSWVYTPEKYRGHGFATALIWNFCKKYRRYKNIMLNADESYPASNKCYQKIGFKKLSINSNWTFK